MTGLFRKLFFPTQQPIFLKHCLTECCHSKHKYDTDMQTELNRTKKEEERIQNFNGIKMRLMGKKGWANTSQTVFHQNRHQESIRRYGLLKDQEAAFWPKGCKLESLIHSCSTEAAQQHQPHKKMTVYSPSFICLLYTCTSCHVTMCN